MFRRLLLMTMAATALCACAPRTRFADTKTIHDAAASRIWIIEDTGDGQHVVLCDVAMFQQAGTLCMRASVAQAPPTQPPMLGHMAAPRPAPPAPPVLTPAAPPR